MGSNETKRKRGRPKGESKPNRQYRLVMPEKDFDELERLCRITGKSKADFIREAIDIRSKEIEAERLSKFSYLSRNGGAETYFDDYGDGFYDEF